METDTKPTYYIKHDDLIASDQAIFDLLSPARKYQELPSHWIAKFLGRHPIGQLPNRLAQLTELGHLDCYKPNQKTSKHFSYASRALGFSKSDRPHRILQDLVKASIELGVREHPELSLVEWDQIINATDKRGNFIVPKSTLDLIAKGKNPHLVPLEASHVLPDGRPFLLRQGTKHLYVLGFEIDRATEPLTTTKERRNIEEKFKHYAELFGRKLYRTHYGFDNAIVIFVTVNEARMHSMIRIFQDEYGPAGWPLFAVWKDWFYERSYPKPTGEMLTRLYLRPGRPPFNLATLGESK